MTGGVPGAILGRQLVTHLQQKVNKRPLKRKKVGARKATVEGIQYLRLPKVGRCGSQTVNTICFEGVSHVKLRVFGITFGGNLVPTRCPKTNFQHPRRIQTEQ